MNRDSKIYTVFFSFVLTFAFVFILSFVNEAAKGKILENQELFLKRAVLNAIGFKYKDDEEAAKIFDDKISKKTVDGKEIYSAHIDNKMVFGLIFSGNGLWSTIRGVIAYNPTEERIQGIDIIEQNETPGLGGRIEEESFKEQFSDEKIINGKIQFIKGQGFDSDKNNGQVDAITGATATSKYLEKIINSALIELKEILSKNGMIL